MHSSIVSGNLAIIFLVLLVVACSGVQGQTGDTVTLLLDYETGYGGAVYPVYNPYVFFRDGSVAKEPKVAIDEIDRSARSKDHAARWGKWKRSGNKVSIVWDGVNRRGKTDTKEADWPGNPAYPGGRNETLEGSWRSVGGGGNIAIGGSVGVLTSKRFTFTRDGRFTTDSSTGATAPGVTAASKKGSAGRYTIDGYTIKLEFDNGDSRRLFFCFYGKDKSVLRIAGSNYTSKR